MLHVFTCSETIYYENMHVPSWFRKAKSIQICGVVSPRFYGPQCIMDFIGLLTDNGHNDVNVRTLNLG